MWERVGGGFVELTINMPCPAAVRAAAAAVWLLAVLGPGLCVAAEDDSEPGFTSCSHCFYRQTPPQGASAAPSLRPLCHGLPGGRAFATLSRSTCDTAVYSAFSLSHGWTEGEGEELVTDEDKDSIKVAVPALLRRGEDPSNPVSPEDSPVERWDSAVKTLVQSSVFPQCTTLGGDLYILTGAGALGAAEDADEGCQTRPLWSALCCTVPEGKGGFSVGIIRDVDQGERQVSVTELGEILGVSELFSEGCVGTDMEAVTIPLDMFSNEYSQNVRNTEGDAAGEEGDTDLNSGSTYKNANEYAKESTETETSEEHVDTQSAEPDNTEENTQRSYSADAQPEESDDADVAQKSSSDGATSESTWGTQEDDAHSSAARTKYTESSGDKETAEELERNNNSSSTVVYILSTTMSILKAPLRPIFSRITSFPGQVFYVLQEDVGVLSALPGDTFNLFHLLTSDSLSYMRSAAETLFGIGDRCFCSAYHCTSSMAGALLDSCQTGVVGMGTLAGDTLGIFGDVLDNAWWVTKRCGGQLWEWSSGYMGTVASEMGGQTQAVGGGIFKLIWSSCNTVWKIFSLIFGFIFGILDIIFGGFRIAFGQDNGE